MTPWTVAHQAPLSMGYSRQEYWSGLPFPSPGHLTDPGIKSWSPTLQADSLPMEPPGKPDILYVLPPSFALMIIDFYCILINIMVCDNKKKTGLSTLTV